jgi:hypothetical protein
MAASNYLQLTNRVLNAFNEVELTSVNFTNTVGFYTEAKNAVNQAIFDVYSYENVKWPFLYTEQSISATRGVFKYTAITPNVDTDWESFYVARGTATISGITRSGSTAIVTTATAHGFVTGDLIYIDGCDQTGYNKDSASITVTSTTQFTYTVDSSTVSPATTTTGFVCLSNTVQWQRLSPIDINEYNQNYAKTMENQTSSSFDTPSGVVRNQNNNIIIFYAPDRTYTIKYTSFVVPAGLSAYNDTHLVPEKYEQVIVDMALHYCYMFRDNADEAQLATKRGEDRIRRMRKDLMPIQSNINWG